MYYHELSRTTKGFTSANRDALHKGVFFTNDAFLFYTKAQRRQEACGGGATRKYS
jgi:hypothetical protein